MKSIYLKLKELADIISDKIISEIAKLPQKIKIASIILGDDPSCMSYLSGMKKKGEKLGIDVDIIQFDTKIEEKKLLKEIENYNKNKKYSGIIIQVPLPKQIAPHNVALAIDYKKDIDGIHPLNQGLLFCNKPFLIPATALAVDLSLKYISEKYSFSLKGKNAVIMGRSLTVGKPLFHLLLNKNITPTIVHTKTQNTQKITSNADIVIVACGIPELITGKWIKKGSIVIDVGIHCVEFNNEKGYKICGDINADSVIKKAFILTAVPGGIGSITSVLIFANAIKSWYMTNQDKEFCFNF